jgi:hypothetical protein
MVFDLSVNCFYNTNIKFIFKKKNMPEASSLQPRRRVSAPLLVGLIIAGVIGGFLIIWVSIVNYVGSVSGWKTLAKNYPNNAQITSGQKTPVGFAMFNTTNYRGGALSLEALPEGLRLTALSIFKIGHPPILIPWSELENVVSETADNGSFTTKKTPGVHMQFFNLSNWILQQKQKYEK